MPVTSTASGTQAVDRAAQLVSTVVHADEPLTFADLQEASGLAKSTASRILAALERCGLVERDEAGSYVAGSLFWLYAARHDPWEELVRLARPVMERLGEESLESVHLSVIRGDQVVQVAQVDSRFLLGTRDWTEIDVPPHASALGKVFYGWGALPLPTDGLERLTGATLVDPGALRRDVLKARERGWALTRDELEVGLTGLAVPIHGHRDDVVAALGVSGPTARLQGRLDDLGHSLSAHATQLSGLLRGSTPQPITRTHTIPNTKEGVA